MVGTYGNRFGIQTGGEVMVWENELNDRKKTILKSIIDSYIQSAQPVGSRTIARKHELGLGSATIRNEMADLEELGYITQPHTSAGRIPSDKGYRFYVDHLMQVHRLEYEEMMKIKNAMDEHVEELNQLIRKASSIISSITGYTSIVLTPQLSNTVIKSAQIITVDEKRLLVVVVAGGGIVKNKIVKHDSVFSEDNVSSLANAINSFISGRPVSDVSLLPAINLAGALGLSPTITALVTDAVMECVRKIETTDVYLEGVTNLLNYPEFSDLLKAREVLEFLKEEEVVESIARSALKNNDLEVKIGSENEIGTMKELSMVTTVYGREGKDIGALGIIGPTRMMYAKVVSSIKYMKNLLDREIMRMFHDE